MFGLLASRRHARLRNLLSAYIDGEVTESEAARVEEHLSGCEECRPELDSLRSTVGLLRQLPELELPRSYTLSEAPSARLALASPVVWTARFAT